MQFERDSEVVNMNVGIYLLIFNICCVQDFVYSYINIGLLLDLIIHSS